ncbi:MAG: hypothetical protein ACYCU8_14480, partial [Ferrimicrobium acidiphilum]
LPKLLTQLWVRLRFAGSAVPSPGRLQAREVLHSRPMNVGLTSNEAGLRELITETGFELTAQL